MKFSRLLFFQVISVLMTSCLSEIEFETGDSDEKLVVEGFISNIDETYIVKLTTLANVNRVGTNTLGRDAQVFIINSVEDRFPLIETSPGIYVSNSSELKGVIGESYKLYVCQK